MTKSRAKSSQFPQANNLFLKVGGNYQVRYVMVTTVDYSINEIKDEARSLVDRGIIDRHQPICDLCEFIPPREWVCMEWELEENDYLLRDRICDLLAREVWEED